MTDQHLKVEIKPCPKCGVQPEVSFDRVGALKVCAINCPNIGCPHYYPIVATALKKKDAMKKAAARWNERIEEGESV